MVCHLCQAAAAKKFGKTRQGHQRYRCRTCRKTFSERPECPLGAMRIPIDRAILCLTLLCEGSSVRAVERITGTEKKTILRLLVQVGEGCERLLAEKVRGVAVADVQCDELWSYVTMKEGTKARKNSADPDAGDAYCFVGLERTSKLVLAFHLGRRNSWDAHDFAEKLSKATAGRFQLSTDGWNAYPAAVEFNLGARVDYAMLVKEYATAGGEEARRYAPPRLIGSERIKVSGEPEGRRICTSHVERVNWTMRGHLRRLTRLSNGFSRKRENLRAALALFFAYYNLVKFHRSICMTPAMKAGVALKPWSVGELVVAAMAA